MPGTRVTRQNPQAGEPDAIQVHVHLNSDEGREVRGGRGRRGRGGQSVRGGRGGRGGQGVRGNVLPDEAGAGIL